MDGRLIDAFTTIASQAAAAVLAIRRPDIATRTKADQSPVTAADEASNTVIAEGLSLLLPGIPVVSEESASPSIMAATTFVLVDPLDGTKEFLTGHDEYTVNLALVVKGKPVAGVIAVPALALVYRGVVGGGAERLRLAPGEPVGQATEVVGIRTRARPAEGLVATVSRSHLEPATEAFLRRLPVVQRLACGSALKFCRVAEGTADVYPRLSPTCEWDVAAGCAIVAAAGGVVVTPEGPPLTFGQAAGFRVPAFVAWGDQESVVSP
jgi:3'(2'), 5'-bisphosphate nucleotidase